MRDMLRFLQRLPSAYYAGIMLATAIVSIVALNNAHQRSLGAERVHREQADSIAKVAIARARQALDIAERKDREAAALRAQARQEAARDAAAIARADAAIATAAAERDAARRLLEDSLATVAQLRVQVGRLVETGRADSVAHAAERAQFLTTKASLQAVIDGDSATIQGYQTAVDRMRERAEAAERRVGSGKASRGGLLARCGANVGYGGVLTGGAVRAGPGVMASCRLFP